MPAFKVNSGKVGGKVVKSLPGRNRVKLLCSEKGFLAKLIYLFLLVLTI